MQMKADEGTAIVHTSGCLVCGADLVYDETQASRTCSLCSGSFPTNARCREGHFVCDTCHGLPALDLIEQVCLASSDTDPLRLASALMANPAVKMHGPEHHFLVPAALITAFCSVHKDASKSDKLKVARTRAADVKGGFCGFHGTCGAAMGAGIACSVLTGATPLAKEGWRLSNLMTAACLTAIGEAGGPRCCKRDTFLALLVGRDFLNTHLDGRLPLTPLPTCSHSARNKECLGPDCQFFQPS
ncbi:MAG TPA: DUF5714 domain-containing protein [Geomonas sp.]|nr:DUF5714 domain-containing protein [Geomonas sp.]